MRKPKSKAKQAAANKRGFKRRMRFKASRVKVARKREEQEALKKLEKKKFEEMMLKFTEARMKGEM